MKIVYLTLLMAALSVTAAHAQDTKAPAAAAPVAKTAPAAPAKKGDDFKMTLDTNGDGVVTKEEFMQSQEKRFAEMDTNKDGKVTSEEMKASWDRFKAKRKVMTSAEFEKMMSKNAPAPAKTPAQ